MLSHKSYTSVSSAQDHATVKENRDKKYDSQTTKNFKRNTYAKLYLLSTQIIRS